MPAPRQLEFFPQKKRTAAERRALIRKRLEGLEFRQRARAQRRLELIERRKARESGETSPETPEQVTIEEMIARNLAPMR
jgi:hypothetical protein